MLTRARLIVGRESKSAAVVAGGISGGKRLYATSVMPAGSGRRCSVNGKVVTVFGATGFLGRYVVNRLGRVGTQMQIPFRGDEYYYRHLRPMGDVGQINFLPYSISDEKSIADALQYSNICINLIGQDIPTRNFTFEQAHVEAPKTIAKMCKQFGIERLVHVSCLNARPDSPSSWHTSKYAGEQAVLSEYPSATIVRPSRFYGGEDRYLNFYARAYNLPMHAFPIGDGGIYKKMPVYVGDVARAIVESLEDPSAEGRVFELVGPKTYSQREIIDHVMKVTKKALRPWPCPKSALKVAGSLISKGPYYTLLDAERVEREYQDDALSEDAYGFEDLAITPVTMERQSISFLRRYRDHYNFEEALEE
eukprot:Nk52_evm106s224 gene=Nk52_evmTU106s224